MTLRVDAKPLSVHRVPAAAAVDGPPVLFVHGLASRGRVDWPDAEWDDVLPGRERIVVDLPAHGASFAPTGPLPTSAVVDLLQDVVSAAGGEVDVVGYSLGARLAWDLVARGGVRRAVLAGLSPFEPFAMMDLAAARSALAGGDAPADPLTGMILGMVRLPGVDSAGALNLIEGLAAEPFDAAVGVPRIPVLFARGASDDLTAALAGVAAAAPDARFAEVPGDHLQALHTPEFRAAVREFLTS
jgi:pimeloyl-ACP methyl ester carboxylesterase